jgi:hypothetical protein
MEGKEPLGSPRRRWNDIIKISIKMYDGKAWNGSVSR